MRGVVAAARGRSVPALGDNMRGLILPVLVCAVCCCSGCCSMGIRILDPHPGSYPGTRAIAGAIPHIQVRRKAESWPWYKTAAMYVAVPIVCIADIGPEAIFDTLLLPFDLAEARKRAQPSSGANREPADPAASRRRRQRRLARGRSLFTIGTEI